MIKFTAKHRDLLFLLILVVLIKLAMNLKHKPNRLKAPSAHEAKRALISQDNDLMESFDEQETSDYPEQNEGDQEGVEKQVIDEDISLSITPEEDDDQDNIVHKPDEHLMYQLNALSDQTEDMLQLVDVVSQEAAQLKGVHYYLSNLKRKYQHTSPAIALLGPIGTAGIVAKERDLEKELFRVAQRLSSILEKLSEFEALEEKAENVLQAIEMNKTLLAKVAKKNATENENS